MVASLIILVPFVAVAVGGAGIKELGTLTMVSGSIYVAGLLFAAWAVYGIVLAVQRREASGRLATFSLWTARGLLALHLIAAAYFVYWGPIGWKTWG
jgi:hypothetical protein